MSTIQLMTLDPGHFHAALVQKEMYDGVDPRVHVYAPLGSDVLTHLTRIAGFNHRAVKPTSWQVEAHLGPDALGRMLRERPGNVVVLSGNNRNKFDAILAAVKAGFHVLADKPWIIEPERVPLLEEALNTAEKNGTIAYDIMTERHEITSILQKELVNDRAIFGDLLNGTEEQPGITMRSKHFLMKMVAGVPIRRPAWFFDIYQQGEGLTDVGTHLVDLVSWIAFPNRRIDPPNHIKVISGQRRPTVLTREEFQKVTGESNFPEFLAPNVHSDTLHYFCNTQVTYTIGSTYIGLDVLWDYKAPDGTGDTHFADIRGGRSRVVVIQDAETQYRPELFVYPNPPDDEELLPLLQRRVDSLQTRYPDVGLSVETDRYRITIPERYRIGHEAHFGEVTRDFLNYLRNPHSLPEWEKSNMLAKYYLTTQGVKWCRSVDPG